MSIRVDVQMDHESESTRYVATATLDGKRLHAVGEYGGAEVRDEVFRKMAAWLKSKHTQCQITIGSRSSLTNSL